MRHAQVEALLAADLEAEAKGAAASRLYIESAAVEPIQAVRPSRLSRLSSSLLALLFFSSSCHTPSCATPPLAHMPGIHACLGPRRRLGCSRGKEVSKHIGSGALY